MTLIVYNLAATCSTISGHTVVVLEGASDYGAGSLSHCEYVITSGLSNSILHSASVKCRFCGFFSHGVCGLS